MFFLQAKTVSIWHSRFVALQQSYFCLAVVLNYLYYTISVFGTFQCVPLQNLFYLAPVLYFCHTSIFLVKLCFVYCT